MNKEITPSMLNDYQKEVDAIPQSSVVRRAIMNQGINAVSEDPMVKAKLHRTFSIDLTSSAVTAQEKSGRCWLFATLNTLRHEFEDTYHIKDFQFSQNYLSFWDRLEKANSFYEHIIETADRPTDDRRVMALLKMPDDDGGQWDNAAALIKKYGLVPKYAMPETQPSNHTDEFSALLGKQLRKDAMILRDAYRDGVRDDALKELKEKCLAKIYRFCVYAFGEPVKTFDFEYRDKDNQYHCDQNLTPVQFLEKYVTRNFDDYVVLCNAPDRAFQQRYILPDETNIQGGQDVTFINVPLDTLKDVTLKQLQDGMPTWFGCDVLQQMSRKEGLLDAKLFDYDQVFQTDLSFTKKDRLHYYEAVCSHAMTFTGVDIMDGTPTKWKVENSWGDKIGDKGYFVMDDNWFDDYVYEVVINKKYLPKETLEALSSEPVRLELWDALA